MTEMTEWLQLSGLSERREGSRLTKVLQDSNSSQVRYYLERFGFGPRRINEAPHSQLGIIVVIPCFDEPDLVRSLESLWNCERTTCAIEVIVVVNSSTDTPDAVLRQNKESLETARAWAGTHSEPHFRFHLLDCPDLPPRKAGVGLARKIGMDEALRRFDQLKRFNGILLCFDADCTCDRNYLCAVADYFAAHPQSPGCSIYFEHPLEGSEDARIYEAVTLYELHLRYYIEGLRWAGFPGAHHTIGSSMAVRASAYYKEGGMNTRQAGEDFYFLHKIIPLSGFGEVNNTRVIPSPRPSARVPFGTGKAVRDFLETGEFNTYPLEAFEDLKSLGWVVPALRSVAALQSMDLLLGEALPQPMLEFLKGRGLENALREIRQHTSSEAAFEKRFFRWFNGFAAMKYIHHAELLYGARKIGEVARELLGRLGAEAPVFDARSLLDAYRVRQRSAGSIRLG